MDPDRLLYMYVRKEAVLSSQIEGTQSTLSDLLEYETKAAPEPRCRMWRRFPATWRRSTTAFTASEAASCR
jgi:hypothetical protein